MAAIERTAPACAEPASSPVRMALRGPRLGGRLTARDQLAGTREASSWSTARSTGTTAGLAGCVALLAVAARADNLLAGLAPVFTPTGLLAMFGFGADANLATEGRWKSRLRRLDHASIFMMDVGPTHPLVIFAIPGPQGWSLLAVVWTGAIAGATLKLLAGRRLSACRSSPISRSAGRFDRAWTIARRSVYAGHGSARSGRSALQHGSRDAWQRGSAYHNALWHMFVLGAASCHFAAVPTRICALPV